MMLKKSMVFSGILTFLMITNSVALDLRSQLKALEAQKKAKENELTKAKVAQKGGIKREIARIQAEIDNVKAEVASTTGGPAVVTPPPGGPTTLPEKSKAMFRQRVQDAGENPNALEAVLKGFIQGTKQYVIPADFKKEIAEVQAKIRALRAAPPPGPAPAADNVENAYDQALIAAHNAVDAAIKAGREDIRDTFVDAANVAIQRNLVTP